MKPIYHFIITMICGFIGCTAGSYIGFKLYEIYGLWSILFIIPIVLVLVIIFYYLIGLVMNRPAIEILKYDDPEDELDGRHKQ